jgi:hypothetical protein
MSKKFIPVLFLFFSIQTNLYSINLVVNCKSDYKIVISSNASYWDSIAAKELQKYIESISGANLPIIDDLSLINPLEIVIGKNKHSENIETSEILYDGFIIKSSGDKIYLIGIDGRGSLNAVYTFLEKYLGCRMYSAEVQVIPEQNSINLPQIDILENPVFTYREIYYRQSRNDTYSRWHKLVDSEDREKWGLFVHTYQTLLPAEKYFKEHPEYFALRGNIRVPEEPCLSHPEVFNIMGEELRKRITENPDAKFWSVSQNDNFSYCQCAKCGKVDEHEGSSAGSVINFTNKIAREFPNKIISTLAYQYSRKAPLYIKPEKNVNIMLCSIESYRTKPLAEDTSNTGFVYDLSEWSKITDNIILWDYVVQFSNYISPFPNLHILQPNIQLFAKHDVKMMFQQGAGNSNLAEFGELKTYLISKLLWNPYVNIDSVMNDFLNGYYGNAGKYIKKYINLMQDELIKSDAKLWIYSNPVEEMDFFLTPELMNEYNIIFDEAEQAAAIEPIYLERVKIARLPLMFAMLEQAKVLGDKKNGLITKRTEGSVELNPGIISLLDTFYYYTSKIDDVLINEKGLTPAKYYQSYKKILSKTMHNPLALEKPVEFLTTPNWKYPANGEKSLTDGFYGNEDHLFNWVGYEGNDMEVVLDLLQPETVKKIEMNFLQNVFSWIFLPLNIEISISDDGNSFKTISTLTNETPATSEELASPIFAFVKNFSASFENIETRYIKIKASNMNICPRWHPGYPLKGWIFVDELVVE